MSTITTRLANFDDVPSLQQLIAASVRELSKDYYTSQQIESAIKYIFGVDTQLLVDGTYYVVEADNMIVACGGWSKRKTLYGGDQHKSTADPLLDPSAEAARIRAFFVHPDWARQGIGKMMINLCETEAMNYGFKTVELGATLPGVPLYTALGYQQLSQISAQMPDGESLPVVRMHKVLINA